MHKWAVLLILSIVMIPCTVQKEGSRVEQRIQRIENSLVEVNMQNPLEIFQADRSQSEKEMNLSQRMKELGVPGVSLAVINDHEIEWSKAYGVREIGSDKLVNTETLFEAASTTKWLASVIVLRLAEQGRLNLDEDVNHTLKTWKIPENEFTKEQKVTLRLLLTHQSGLNRPEGGFDWEERSTPSLIQVLNGESPAINKAAAVEYVPGTKHQYSNIGYLVIQLLLEEVLEKPFSQIAQEILFEPLGMKNSTLVHPLEAKFRTNIALPHDSEGKAHQRDQHPTALAQGGLVTTPSDLALLAIEVMEAYQGRSDRILSQRAVQQMFSTERELDPSQMMGIPAQGLGVFLMGEGGGFYFLFAGYNEPGATSFLIAAPATGKGAAIMTNGANGMLLVLEILGALVDEYDWPKI